MLLSLVLTLTVRQANSASIKHFQKAPVPHQGAQHHAASLPRQQPACTNMLDATDLHGEWVEGASVMKARRLTVLQRLPDDCACGVFGSFLWGLHALGTRSGGLWLPPHLCSFHSRSISVKASDGEWAMYRLSAQPGLRR